MFYLYKKTHNKTGLKYLGQTKRNPYNYLGSGTIWKRHLQKHGKNISTEIIGAFDTLDDLKVAGQFWSKQWNIVEDKEWANLRIEEGFGGLDTPEIRLKISLANKGKKRTEEQKQNLREYIKLHPNHFPRMKGKKHTPESIQKIKAYYIENKKLHSERTKAGMTAEVRQKISIAMKSKKEIKNFY